MTRINNKNATLAKPKADFLKYAIAFSINIPLTEDNLKLRDRLVLLAHDEGKLTVSIESPQLSLFDEAPLPDSPNNITDGDEELDGNGMDLLSDERFGEKVFDQMVSDLAAKSETPEPAARGRRRQSGTTTISSGGKSVTVTNEQFSKAARRIEQEGKAAAARSKTKTKKRA